MLDFFFQSYFVNNFLIIQNPNVELETLITLIITIISLNMQNLQESSS